MNKIILFIITLALYGCETINTDIEIPVIVKQEAVKWNWTVISSDNDKKILTDLTKQGKTSDGSIFLPWAKWSLKDNRWASNTMWFRINCEKNTIETFGSYRNGHFSGPGGYLYKDSEFTPQIPKHMICGITTQEGTKLFGLTTRIESPNLFIFGWIPEEIKKEDIQDALITFNAYGYNYNHRKNFREKALIIPTTVDCITKKVKQKTTIDLNDGQHDYLIYMYNSVCAFKDNLANQTDKVIVEIKPQNDSAALRAKSNESKGGGGYDTTAGGYDPSDATNIKPTLHDKDSSPLDLSSAKKKCEELGFKPKTEKFGKCVLELSK